LISDWHFRNPSLSGINLGMTPPLNVAVVGATGAVGNEMIRLLEERNFPVGELRLLASERSLGKTLMFRGQPVEVQRAAPSCFEGVDLALFSAGASRSRELAPHAVKAGAIVIDNSSAFRMNEDVPLVVPEINWDSVKPEHKIFGVPNCTAIVMLMAVFPLTKLGRIERIVMSSYQSASGGGAALMADLEKQTLDAVSGKTPEPAVSPHLYAFNLFSHNTPINSMGYNEEEAKVIQESRKILGMPNLRIGVTCVRVPVLRAHSVAITVEFQGSAPSEDAIREALSVSAGVRVIDDREKNHFPMPAEASGQDDVLVGRIRRDISHPSAICLFVCGDQLRKGAALNAIQIAEKLLARQPLGIA
jgi:aspartate-semialdehyde dehydrogenase